MKILQIEEDLLKGLLEYLSLRPWKEVAVAMDRLQRLEVIETPDKE